MDDDGDDNNKHMPHVPLLNLAPGCRRCCGCLTAFSLSLREEDDGSEIEGGGRAFSGRRFSISTQSPGSNIFPPPHTHVRDPTFLVCPPLTHSHTSHTHTCSHQEMASKAKQGNGPAAHMSCAKRGGGGGGKSNLHHCRWLGRLSLCCPAANFHLSLSVCVSFSSPQMSSLAALSLSLSRRSPLDIAPLRSVISREGGPSPASEETFSVLRI